MPKADFLRSSLLAQHHITGIFSERQGGISPAPFDTLNLGLDLGDSAENVQQNLVHLAHSAHIPIPHRSQQVHGTNVLKCHGDGVLHQHDADILITSELGVSVGIRTADCLPILLVDPKAGIAAAVHAGWRGTANQVAIIAIQAMQELGARSEHILASLGPSIGPCCFEINLNTAEQLSQSHPQAHTAISTTTTNAHANIQAINRLQLLHAGVLSQHVEHLDLCTSCLNKRFFSWRRDKHRAGRQLSIVALPESL